jgi:hypothetical protein
MSKYNDAAKALAREAARTEGLLQAAKVLGEAGALESVVGDLERRREQARKDLDVAVANATGARVNVADHIARAEQEAARTREAAEADAQSVRAEAKEVLQRAHEKATGVMVQAANAATQATEAAADKVAEAEARFAATVAKLREAETLILNRDAEASALEQRVAKAQAAAARVMGN